MSQIVFPNSPSDGDEFLADNGTTYQYDSTTTQWKILAGPGAQGPPGDAGVFANATATGGISDITDVSRSYVDTESGRVTTQVITAGNTPPWIVSSKFFGTGQPSYGTPTYSSNIASNSPAPWVMSGNTATRVITNTDGLEEYAVVSIGNSIGQKLLVSMEYEGYHYEFSAINPGYS